MLITTDLNHVALHVSDLETSVVFYAQVLGFERIPRPDFDFPGAWFRLGEAQELHLIAGLDGSANSGKRGTHFAIGVESIEDTERFFERQGLSHTPRQIRPDGVLQIYVEDPDGYWIEFCENSLES